MLFRLAQKRSVLARLLCFAPLFVLMSCTLQRQTEGPTASPTNMIVPPPKPLPPDAIPIQPPRDMAEQIPTPPGPTEDWAWQRGHWLWNGSNYVWDGGKWAKRPNYGAEWLAPHWDQVEGGWAFVEGNWR